jgi:hypothetical protein
MKKNINEKWLRLDEVENTIDNLEMVEFFLREIKSSKKWKWVTIATHMALYGFVICAANNPPYQLVIKYSKRYPEGRLISLNEAIEFLKVPIPPEAPNEFFPVLKLTSEQEIAINSMAKEFRDKFEHYRPLGWSIAEACFPKIIHEVIKVIRFIALESKRVNTSIYDEEQIIIAIESIEILLKKYIFED